MQFSYLYSDNISQKEIAFYNPIQILLENNIYTFVYYNKTTLQIKKVENLKRGSFLYFKNNKYCIYYANKRMMFDFPTNALFRASFQIFDSPEKAVEKLYSNICESSKIEKY